MEFEAPAIVLSAAPYGEADALASIFTEAHGIYRGLARGGRARAHAALWQAGNLVQARWVARLPEQLGTVSAELVHSAASLALDDAWVSLILSAACTLAESALPERATHPRIFRGLLHLVAHAAEGEAMIPELVRWELGLLQDLGYGLDLTECALTGERRGLAFVSPRTGRAVTEQAAGLWKERLLPLPAFLAEDGAEGGMADWAAGLRLTGHFLARNALGIQHRGMPAARIRLVERVTQHAG